MPWPDAQKGALHLREGTSMAGMAWDGQYMRSVRQTSVISQARDFFSLLLSSQLRVCCVGFWSLCTRFERVGYKEMYGGCGRVRPLLLFPFPKGEIFCRSSFVVRRVMEETEYCPFLGVVSHLVVSCLRTCHPCRGGEEDYLLLLGLVRILHDWKGQGGR